MIRKKRIATRLAAILGIGLVAFLVWLPLYGRSFHGIPIAQAWQELAELSHGRLGAPPEAGQAEMMETDGRKEFKIRCEMSQEEWAAFRYAFELEKGTDLDDGYLRVLDSGLAVRGVFEDDLSKVDICGTVPSLPYGVAFAGIRQPGGSIKLFINFPGGSRHKGALYYLKEDFTGDYLRYWDIAWTR